MDLHEHLKRTELIKQREASLSNWRGELSEEGDHPYVDIMPCSDEEEQMIKDAKKKKKKEEQEEVKEETFKEKQKAARKRLDLNKKAIESGKPHLSPYGKHLKPKYAPAADPWSAHASDAKAHSKEDRK